MQDYIPKAAQIILDFIRKTEVGTDGPNGYNVIYGHNQDKLDKYLTEMTVLEVQQNQQAWSAQFGSSASGGYQFMYKTLGGLIEELKKSGNPPTDITHRKFNADLQDDLGYMLLLRRGFKDWVNGKINDTTFAKQLAQEWASFPVLDTTNGAHRTVYRGQSYYAGDGLNKALVSATEIEDLLQRARTAVVVVTPESEIPTPTMPPKAAPSSMTVGILAGVILVVILVIYMLAS